MPLSADTTLLQQVIAAFTALCGCPRHLDHLFLAWAADLRGTGAAPVPTSLEEVVASWNTAPPPPFGRLPSVPLTDDQMHLAADLQRLHLLAVDHRPTLLGQALVAYALTLPYPFLQVPYPTDEEPAWAIEAVPEPA